LPTHALVEHDDRVDAQDEVTRLEHRAGGLTPGYFAGLADGVGDDRAHGIARHRRLVMAAGRHPKGQPELAQDGLRAAASARPARRRAPAAAPAAPLDEPVLTGRTA